MKAIHNDAINIQERKNSPQNKVNVDPVDEILPLGQMLVYGLQHVLVMYAGAIAVPLIIGKAVGFTPEQIIFLISTDLFICGCATILQSIGLFNIIGSKLPIVQGCTFAALIPMALIGQQYGIGGISGAVIIAGGFTLLCAPFVCKLVRFSRKPSWGPL